MKNSSILSCEHIHIHRVAGLTDAFIACLQDYLRTLFGLLDEFGSAKIQIANDGRSDTFEWLGEALPAPSDGAIEAMRDAEEIDVRVDMCSDLFKMDTEQSALSKLLRDGSLKNCVQYCALVEDEQTSSLTMSGMYRGAFLHGAVPFTTYNEDILEIARWNGYTHRAEFHLAEGSAEAARNLVEQLEERLEIELTLSDDGRALIIDGLQLAGREQIRFYREALETLVRLSDSSLITGALTPEDDEVFALLRFVQAGASVALQTAVAEY